MRENKLEGKEKREKERDIQKNNELEGRRTRREEKRGEITRRESSTTISMKERYRTTKAQKIELLGQKFEDRKYKGNHRRKTCKIVNEKAKRELYTTFNKRQGMGLPRPKRSSSWTKQGKPMNEKKEDMQDRKQKQGK